MINGANIDDMCHIVKGGFKVISHSWPRRPEKMEPWWRVMGLWKSKHFRGGGWWKCHHVHDISPLGKWCQKRSKTLLSPFDRKRPFGTKFISWHFRQGKKSQHNEKTWKVKSLNGHFSTCYVKEVKVSRWEIKRMGLSIFKGKSI